MTKRFSLQRKIALAQITIYVVVYLCVLALTPTAVYFIARGTQVKETMAFNQQIAMRMEARFSEVARFSNMVAMDNELNGMLREVRRQPSEKNRARLRLGMSGLIQQDGISTYQVLGILLCLDDGFETSTVGLNESLAEHIRQNILPQYAASGERQLFTEPFALPPGNNLSLWGNEFSKGFGYVSPYNMNGIRGTLVIIASYDGIAYITDDLGEACTDYVLLSASGRQIEPAQGISHIDADRVMASYRYGGSYQEGSCITPEGVYAVRHVYAGNWHMITFLSRSEVIARNRPQRYVIIFSFAVFGMVSILSSMAIVHKYVRPLKDVSRQMDAIANGDFNARVLIRSMDEIGQVSEAFNVMAARLEHTMDEMLEREKLEQKMRYSLLIAQVDPHFIYNTMNTITYLAQKGENENVIVVNRAMIGILQDRLRIEVDDVYDTVRQEVNVVQQYLTIQRYRYQGIFKEKIQVDEAARDRLMLKNLIQPLVENALAHGILENKDENGEPLGGCVSIDIRLEGETLVVQVSDNGNGMSPERLAEIRSGADTVERGKKIGLRNVRDRIEYIYGDRASMDISSQEGIGTRVVLRLPALSEERRDGERPRAGGDWSLEKGKGV